ncbi:MAG: Sec-independent protein translocase subunit TatA/TatB [Candidatus Binataceae bacterium]
MDIFKIALVLIIALIVLGPEKLPDVLVQAGKVLRELRSASNSVMRELTSPLDETPAVLRPYVPPEPAPPAKPPEISEATEPKPPITAT